MTEHRSVPLPAWLPNDPALSDLIAEVLSPRSQVLDTVSGAFGFRTLTIDGDEWLLRGAPLRQLATGDGHRFVTDTPQPGITSRHGPAPGDRELPAQRYWRS